MPAPSLESLTDVGDFEYWKIRHVLSRITSPEQLRKIELASPQIRGEDAELWKAFIARDIPDWKRKNYVPKNPLKWYEVYMKYKKEQKEEIERDQERLREAMLDLKKEKESHLSKVVDAKHLPKLPKDPRMLANDGGVPIGGRKRGSAKATTPNLAWTGGSKTRMTNGASVLTLARREAREISKRNKLFKPMHQLKAQLSQVLCAPKAMVDEYRKAAEPALKIYTPRRKSGVSNAHGAVMGPSLEERERRLRALTMPSPGEIVTLVGSESDEEEDGGLEDLFDEKEATVAPSPPKRTQSRQHTNLEPLPKTARGSPPTKALTRPKPPPSVPSTEIKPTVAPSPPKGIQSKHQTNLKPLPKIAQGSPPKQALSRPKPPLAEPSTETKPTVAPSPPKRTQSRQHTNLKPLPKTARGSPPTQALTRPKPPPAELSAELKPSDLISSIISKPKPQQSPPRHNTPPPTFSLSSVNTTASPQCTSSPAPQRSPKPLLRPKRKREVDIFNRGGTATKKPYIP